MAAAAYFDTVQKIFIAFYQRPADPAGLKYWADRIDAANGDAAAVVSAFATSPEAVTLYGPIDATTIGAVIDKIYLALFNKAPDPAGKKFYVDGFTAGTFTAGTIALNILNGATNDDAVAIANKLQVSNTFTQQVDGRALTSPYFGTGSSFNATYKGDADAQAARDILKTVTASPSTVLSPSQVTVEIQTKIADAGDPIVGQTSGQTFTLTKGVDLVTGTAGNDTIIADNTAAAAADKFLSVADQINGGAGTDTLKVYLNAADTATGEPTLTNIENVWINGGAVVAYTAATGTTGLTVEAPVANTAATLTLAGQGLTLKSYATTAAITTTVAKAATGTQTAQSITLNGFVDTNAAAVLNTIDVTGAGIATLNLVVTGANSETNLANTTGAAIKTINISGDKNLNAVESAAMASAVTKIDASTATGNISFDTSAGVKSAAFAFTGGSGNDKLTVAAGDLALLTSGAQLNGGAGTDTLVIKDTTPAYAAINKAVGFEVLGLGVTGTTVDAAQLTSIKSFAIGTITNSTINNLGAGSSVSVTGATTTVALGAALGNTATDVSIGSATAAGFTTASLTATGLTTVGLTVNGASLQTITTFGNSDNTTLTIKGAADLTITNALAGTTTGSKVDASALTGKLTVTGSGLSDIIIGGSNDDVLSGGTGAAVSDTLTGGAGKDAFTIIAGATAATADVITDFVTKTDTIEFGGAAGSATNYSEGLAAVADFAAALAAANVALDATVLYSAQQVGSDVWVFADTGATGSATQVVKLTGVALTGIEFIDIV